MTKYTTHRQSQHPLIISNLTAYISALEAAFAGAAQRGYPLRMVIAHGEGGMVKRPVEPEWNKKNPTLEQCIDAVKAGKLLGVVPSSIDCVVGDVDEGNPRALADASPHIACLQSVSGGGEDGGGMHVWFSGGGNLPGKLMGRAIDIDGEALKVDVIYRHPYVLIRPDEMVRFPAIIDAPRTPGEKEFPLDLFAAELKPSAPVDVVKTQREWRPADSRHRRIVLSEVESGNTASVLWKIACAPGQLGRAEFYAGRIGSEADVLLRVVQWNLETPAPLDDAQVERIAGDAFAVLSLLGVGRNHYLFHRVQKWAYKAIRGYWAGEFSDWFSAVMKRAEAVNGEHREHKGGPLDGGEVVEVVKHIARWTWREFSAAGFIAVQRERGRRGGAARAALMREQNAARDGEIRAAHHAGASYRKLASMHGISKSRVEQICGEKPRGY